MSRLSCEGLTVRRGGRAIVDGVSAALEPGTFTALVGANGSGKSTLLAALAGLIRPDAGTVTLDARPLASLGLKALARRRAYLPQQLRAEWPISVERLVALGLTPSLPAFGDLPGGFEPRLTEAIAACDLAPQRHQPATTLSGGELTRAMLARALIGDPDIMLADEPVSGLDPRHALDTVARLRRLAVEEGRIVIAAIHDLTLAARHATHLLALRDGQRLAFGPMAETLTSELLSRAFDVQASVTGVGPDAVVDYAAAP
jgi:iron complex transport system ATP-binding protein